MIGVINVGYGTRYSLGVHEGKNTIAEVFEEHGIDFNGLNYAFDEYGESLGDVKWYDHEEDMLMLSEAYPELVFVLYGEGEEQGDMWYKYFKNNKMQSCYPQITFEGYKENKLR